MDCPHCTKELPSQPCPVCERPALTGATYCHHCGHELPAPTAEPPKLIACGLCGHKSLPEVNYCAGCGEPLAGQDAAAIAGGFNPDERRACSDGLCIGIIGADGKCSECGKPYTPNSE